MNQSTTITVAIPVYNGEKYIDQAVESVLAQSQAPDEILVVNNNSSDGTLEKLKKYESHIKLISHDKTLSMAENWTSCFELANSGFVMILHTDDQLFPDTVKLTSELLYKYSNVDHVFGQTWLYDGRRTFPGEKEKFALLSAEEYFLRSCRSYYHYCSGTTTRRSLALKIGAFNDSYKHITDVKFFIRLGLYCRQVYAINSAIATYRFHDDNLHKSLEKDKIADHEYIRLFKQIGKTNEFGNALREQALKNLAPVLSQSITKSLRDNDMVRASKLIRQITQVYSEYDLDIEKSLTQQCG